MFIRENRDIFAWKPSDMPGVPRELAEHTLNIVPKFKPVRQFLRRFNEERRKAICRVIVMTDVLDQGLSRRAIALGSLKGLIGTKDTRESFYTSLAPYDEGKILRLVGIGIAEVSIFKRPNSPAW